MHEKEMQQAENERLEEVRQRSILRHNLTSSRVNPEKDYPDALTDQSVILHLAQKRLQKPDCQSSFDMRYLPVIRGYVSYDEVQNPTVESKQKLKTALAEYKENAFSYKAIHWALSGYPKG